MFYTRPLITFALLSSSGLIGCSGLYTTKYGDTGAVDANDQEEQSDLPENGSSDSDTTDESENSNDGQNGSNGDSFGGSGDDSTGSDSTDDPGACTHNDFPVMLHQATQNNEDPTRRMFMYQARDAEAAPFTEMQILSFQDEPYFGPSGPGTFDLQDLNYSDCSLCMLILDECDDDYWCDKGFFIESGTLQVNQMSTSGGNFNASVINARFVEVTIDSETYVSTPVSGGESWCVDRLDIELSPMVLD